MEDVGELLNFNPDRDLTFMPGRPLEFDARRRLTFDPRRKLEFNQNRDLGFGRRGVVFRGYVCPICGSLVTETATKCTECGTVFEGPPRASEPSAKGVSPGVAALGKARPAAPPRAEGKSATVSCASCGATLKRADTFCWRCGMRTVGPIDVVKLPQRKQPKVTRDWRGPGEP